MVKKYSIIHYCYICYSRIMGFANMCSATYFCYSSVIAYTREPCDEIPQITKIIARMRRILTIIFVIHE